MSRALCARSQNLIAGGSAPAPWVTFLCPAKEKSPKERPPEWHAFLRFAPLAPKLAQRDVPVACARRGPPGPRPCRACRPKAGDARARHTGIRKLHHSRTSFFREGRASETNLHNSRRGISG